MDFVPKDILNVMAGKSFSVNGLVMLVVAHQLQLFSKLIMANVHQCMV